MKIKNNQCLVYISDKSTLLEYGKTYKVVDVNDCVERKTKLFGYFKTDVGGACKDCVSRCLVQVDTKNGISSQICSYAFRGCREEKLKRILKK